MAFAPFARRGAVCLLLPAFAAPIAAAQLRLPAVLDDGMVLQRNTEATLWGRAQPGARLSIEASWSAKPLAVVVPPSGDWRARLATPDAGGPHTLRISGDGERILRDVWSGEVWLCSGQSNMEWHVSDLPPAKPGVPGPDEEIAAANYPQIRLFDVPNRISNHERRDVQGQWVTCSPATAGRFSATAYFFARKIHLELGVPVGLVTADWGGTPAQAWTSAVSLAEFEEYAAALEALRISIDPNLRYEQARTRGAGWWDEADRRSARPVARDWNQTGFDASAWSMCELPGSMGGDLARFDGFVYFRTELEIPDAWAGKGATLELGPIDDRDDAWFDGQHVGAQHEDGRWSEFRRYAVPAARVQPGKRAICVRVLDTGGTGGINGRADAFLLKSDDAALAPIALAGTWRYFKGPATSEMPPIGSGSGPKIDAHTPSALFNGMLAPLLPLSFRGALWYQGESNVGAAAHYERLFPAMIADWRQRFSNGQFPFYFVQIAPFSYSGAPGAAAELRDAQRKTLERVPNTGMAITMDIGDARDIHPGNKQEVGRRLALWALEHNYGRDLVSHCGPLFESLALEGSKLRVRFTCAEGGLVAKGGAPDGWWIAGADRVFHEADVVLDGACAVVSSALVREPKAVRYGWGNAAMPNLRNAAGLPASSFRTDDWRGPSIVEDRGRTAHLSPSARGVELFNGRDLTGWHNVNCAPSTWTVADGKIVCSGVPTGILRTDKQFENFELELEWRHKVERGNAGLFVWSDALTARGQPFSRAIEVQVMSGMEGPGYTSDGDVFPIHGATMTPRNGRGGARAFPIEARVKPGGEWNHYRVRGVDGKLELAVNGKVVTVAEDCQPRKGYLCLESEGAPIEFRNLRLVELPASLGPQPAPAMLAEHDQGFRALYNGVDFSGWKFGPEHEGHWRADDWTISFDGQGSDLWSNEEFGDFELIADWRWSGPAHDADLAVIGPDGSQRSGPDGKPLTQRVQEAGDSGIYLRGSSKSQVNIWCWPVGSGEVYGYRTDASMPPEVRAAVTPRVNADAPLGEWNRFHVTMVGDRLTVVLNGRTVIERAQLPGVAPRGPIALQMHGSPIQFANLYVKRLD
jgi:sialate O-acetylesterase